MQVAAKMEYFQVLQHVLDPALEDLRYSREDLAIEVFDSDRYHYFPAPLQRAAEQVLQNVLPIPWDGLWER